MDKSERTLENLKKIARSLSADELLEANKYVIGLFKEARRDRDRRAALNFKVGDYVSFKGRRGVTEEGVIEKVNYARVLVKTDAGMRWRVHAGQLTLINRKQRKAALAKGSAIRPKRRKQPEMETPPWAA